MPQSGMSYEGRRRATHHNTCKANGQVPETGLVNAAIDCGPPAAASRPSKTAPAGKLNGTKPRRTVNGFVNHEDKGKSTKVPQARPPREKGCMMSVVTDASAAGTCSGAAIPAGVSVNGAASLDTVALPCNSDQMAPEPGQSAAAKKPRRVKRFRHKRRPPVLPPREEEDWENELQEARETNWEETWFGFAPYGPQDVLHFALRDLTLKKSETADLPVTANYRPAIHHPQPVHWSCHSTPPEPDQFADADE